MRHESAGFLVLKKMRKWNVITTSSILILLLLFLSAEPAAQKKSTIKGKATTTASLNTLTPEEKAAGWKLLFDGKTWDGWRGFRREKAPEEAWVIEEGAIKRTAIRGEPSPDSGDIITTGQYENFELQLEWRISPGGNSGIKYLVAEEMVMIGYSGLGFEFQIIDDERNPDAAQGKNGNRSTGALYDLIAPKNKVMRPAGTWRQVRLIVRGDDVEHWLDGAKVVEFKLDGAKLKELIADSKYKDIRGFGEVRKGHILLQDHGDEVWYRNIKLREIPAL